MIEMPDYAALLAAGLGTRMRPLTNALPKPMLRLAGQTLLEHALDRLQAAGIGHVIVNGHHQVDLLQAHIGMRAKLRRETELLDTGGAVAAMLQAGDLPDAPFFIVNGDAFWLDGPSNLFHRLAAAFDPAQADAVLLLARTAGMEVETGPGDFLWPRGGPLRRPAEREVAPYLFGGIQLVSPALFTDLPGPVFSMNVLWDRALAAGRLTAIIHDGVWFHLSTPAHLERAEAAMAAREVGNST
jgi:MurNAc alpha-1-phosphate uridylyltransferase